MQNDSTIRHIPGTILNALHLPEDTECLWKTCSLHFRDQVLSFASILLGYPTEVLWPESGRVWTSCADFAEACRFRHADDIINAYSFQEAGLGCH